MKNVEKWLYPICDMIASSNRCVASWRYGAIKCSECELWCLCNDAQKLYEYMDEEIEGDEHDE